MDPRETRRQKVTRVAGELGSAIRRQVQGQWNGVRMAERNEPGVHVWRFRSRADGGERFLHVEHRAMARGSNPAARLLEQLESEQWLDRIQQGTGTSLRLSLDGQLAAFPRA